MNQWKKQELFVNIAKKHIEELSVEDFDYNMLKYQLDDSGPICSDSELLQTFKESLSKNIEEDKLYKLIENICLEYCKEIK